VRAIESALAQTLPPLEVIVCDDRSTDDTEAAISALAANDERVRYFRRTSGPRGPGATRNHGLQEARGEFVAFLDDDDEWFAEKLKLQVPVLIASGGLVGSNAVRSSGGNYFPDESDRDILPTELLSHNPFIFSSVIVERERLLLCDGFSERLWIEDYDLILRMADRAEPMVRLGESLLLYKDTGEDRFTVREAEVALAVACLFARRSLRARPRWQHLRATVSKILAATRASSGFVKDRRWPKH
jgi:glycosyltransferase involved in cell wall biosynthesis